MKLLAAATLAAGLLVGATANAAEVYTVQAWIHGPVSSSDNIADMAHYTALSGLTPSATFTWTGPIDWADTTAQNHDSTGGIALDFFDRDGLAPTAWADHATYNAGASTLTEAAFLSKSLTIAGDEYTTFYSITGSYTSADPVIGSYHHDDGASIYVDGVLLPGSTSSETSVVTEGFTLPGDGTHSVQLLYVSGNGTPSILSFTSPGTFGGPGVPEPASWALMVMGFGGLGAMLRRSRRRVASAATA